MTGGNGNVFDHSRPYKIAPYYIVGRERLQTFAPHTVYYAIHLNRIVSRKDAGSNGVHEVWGMGKGERNAKFWG